MVSKHLPLLLSVLALAATLPAVQAAGTPAAAPTVPTVTVGAAALAAGFELEGVVQAQQQVSVSSQAAGRVLSLAVKAGDRVKAGQVLARIDDRELQAGVAGGEAGVAQAQAALVQAEQNAQRTRDLRAQGFLSAAALDGATAQLKAAQAALQQAQAGRSQAALARVHAPAVPIFAGDVSFRMTDFAARNARRAGVQHAIEFKTADALQRLAPAAAGVMLLNPPYGERIEAKGVARRGARESFEAGGSSAEFFSGLAAHWKRHYPGWTAWLLSPDMKLPSLMRLKESRRVPMWNGPIECRMFRFDLVAGSARG